MAGLRAICGDCGYVKVHCGCDVVKFNNGEFHTLEAEVRELKALVQSAFTEGYEKRSCPLSADQAYHTSVVRKKLQPTKGDDGECAKCGGVGTYRESRGGDKDPWLVYCDCPKGEIKKLQYNDDDNTAKGDDSE